MTGEHWDEHYRSGTPPWETGRPSEQLQQIIAEERIRPCRVLELGCGTGTNAIWLAQQGFDVTALDISPLAIEKARQRAGDSNTSVQFMLADVLDLPSELGTFAFLFDRGCYHAVRRHNVQAFLRTLRQITAPGSIGLFLTGNAREPREPGKGPPVVSAEEIHAELGSVFEILHLREFQFDQVEGDGRRFLAWSCLVRRPALTASPKSEQIAGHYGSGYEAERLHQGSGRLDRERSRELMERFLPPPPALVLDIGGGPGSHACWLAARGYQVHLIDITPLHVELARQASARQPNAALASAEIGDARSLSWNSGAADAVVLFGPLYHLTDREDRLLALREAHRVLRPGGVLLAAGISRFASALDGLCRGFLKDPQFAEIVRQDLTDGQHRNPTGKPDYFMDTFFHHPEELRAEVIEAGFATASVHGVEGPCWLLPDFDAWWDNAEFRDRLLQISRTLEREPSLLGVSAHLIAAATK